MDAFKATCVVPNKYLELGRNYILKQQRIDGHLDEFTNIDSLSPEEICQGTTLKPPISTHTPTCVSLFSTIESNLYNNQRVKHVVVIPYCLPVGRRVARRHCLWVIFFLDGDIRSSECLVSASQSAVQTNY